MENMKFPKFYGQDKYFMENTKYYEQDKYFLHEVDKVL